MTALQPAQASSDPNFITSAKRRGHDDGANPAAKRQRLRDVAGSEDQAAAAAAAAQAQPSQQSSQQQSQQQQEQHSQQQEAAAQQQPQAQRPLKGPLGLLHPVYQLGQQLVERLVRAGTPSRASTPVAQEDGEEQGQGQQQQRARAHAHAAATSSGSSGEGDASESEGAAGDAHGASGGAGAAGSGEAGTYEEGGGGGGGGEEDEEEDDEFFDPLLFISRLPPEAPPCAERPPGALLPPRTRGRKQKTLVLDLDETLVHSTLDDAPGVEGAHFHFPVEFNGATHMVHVRTRPHMAEFLERAAQLFEVVIFTASQRVYAERLLNILDPARKLIRARLYRDSCVLWAGNYLKDLSGLGRDLAHTAIIDNSPQAFGFQVDNGIPIESWYDDEGDSELRDLLPLLEQMAASDCDDVRPLLRQRFRLRERVAAAAAAWAARAEQEEAWQAAAVGGSGDGGSDGMMTQAVRSAAAAAAAMQPA